MERNTTTGVWGVIGVIVIIGLIIYAIYAVKNINSQPTVVIQNSPSSTGTGQTTTPVTTPSAPAVTTGVSNPTDTSAVVTGSIIPNGSFTNYWYEYGITPNLGSKTTSQSIGSGYTTIGAPYYITGLTQNTLYYYRLDAQNNSGLTMGEVSSFQTTQGQPSPVGGAPALQTMSASNINRSEANLNGQVTSNNAPTTYWFEYGTTANLGNTTPLVGISGTSVSLPVSLPISALNPLTTYYFRLNAQNEFGTVNGNVLTFNTAGPAAATLPTVRTLSAVTVGTSTATLRGSLNQNGAVTTYWFEYSTDPNFSTSVLQTVGTTMPSLNAISNPISVKVSGLTPNTAYYYRIVAQNTIGTVRGDSASFITKM